MSQESLLKLRKLTKEANHTVAMLIDAVEGKMLSPNDGVALDDVDSLTNLMKKKRKVLGVTLEDLELQTNISTSTLKRLFSDPSSARFSNVIAVLKELGIKSWAER
jgi:hypothetical protein